MKETSFIQQNKDKWNRFEELNKKQNSNPDELSELFVEITEDLSYARTFYPRRSVRVYLNGLAQNVFISLYKIKKNPFGKFLDFWRKGLPLEMYRARKNLLYAFLIFSISGLIGVVSTANDLNFAKVILSDGYVEMTNDFIERGDPMAVYKEKDSYMMFLQIFYNNIQVAFYCFILGLLFSVGTGFFMVYNGIMLGSFQSYFYFKGLTKSAVFGKTLLLTTFLTIWIHGAFEISAIIIAGAAGLTLGNGLMFPGTYTRLQSLQISAKRGIKIMAGLMPFFLIAAIFESWVTRHTEMPLILKGLIIFGSFAIILLYFVIYPFIVARKYPDDVELNEEPLFHPPVFIEKFKIRPINELFSDAFGLYRMTAKLNMKGIFTILIPLNLIYLVYMISQHYYFFGYRLNPFELVSGIYGLNYTVNPLSYVLTGLIIFLNISIAFYALENAYSKTTQTVNYYTGWFRYLIKRGYRLLLPAAAFMLLTLSNNPLLLLAAFGMIPVVFYLIAHIAHGKQNVFRDFGTGFSNGFKNYGNGFLLLLMYLFLTSCFFLIFSGFAMVSEIIVQTIQWHILTTQSGHYWEIMNGITALFFIVFLQLIMPLYWYAYSLLYYNHEEKTEATGLYQRFEKFGKTSKTYESDFEEHED